MVRWNYVIPRLLLLALICAIGYLVLNPVLRWSLIWAGQSAVGAKIEIRDLRSDPWQTELRLSGIRVADPNAADRNVFQADQAVLTADTEALLRRKLVVRDGELSGILVGSGRDSSGQLDGSGGVGPFGDRMTQAGQRWMDDVSDRLLQDVEDQSESVRLARELHDRWPAEYQDVQTRAESVGQRARRLVDLLEQGPDDPLRAVQMYEQAAADLDKLRIDSHQLRQDLHRLGQQAALDRVAIREAKDRDIEKIQETLRMENLDAAAISEYLLGPELGPRVGSLVQWVQWGRQFVPAGDQSAGKGLSGRGIDILSPETQPSPDVLIQRLALSGQGQLDGQAVQFVGTATDLTPQPKIHGQPATVHIQTRGSIEMSLRAVLDRTQDASHDRFEVDWPALPLPQRTLGRPDGLAVVVAPGVSQMQAQVELRRDKLSGQIHIQQQPADLQLAASTANHPALDGWSDHLAAVLSDVHTLDGTLQLSGTLANPHWKISSNLGPTLAAGLNTALDRELDTRRTELVARVEAQVNHHLTTLHQLLSAKEQQVLRQLNIGDAEIAQLKQAFVSRLQTRLLGDGSPLRNLLRR